MCTNYPKELRGRYSSLRRIRCRWHRFAVRPKQLLSMNHEASSSRRLEHFISGETSSVSSQLATVEQVTRRRHREWIARIESTEDRISSFWGQLITESIDRENSDLLLLRQTISEPLREVVHRISNRLDEDERKNTDRLEQLLDDVNQFTNTMVEFENVTLVQCQKAHWNDTVLVQKAKVLDSIPIEKSKTEKRELGLHSRWDSLAAKTTAHWASERAESRALLHLLDEQVQNIAATDERRIEDFIQKVQALKQNMVKERRERQKRDEEILELILKTQEMLQKQLLESL